MLLKLKYQPDIITFLLSINIENYFRLKEFIGELENGFLNSSDILDLIKCIEFFSRLGDGLNIKEKIDAEIISSFIKAVKNNDKIKK